MRKLKMALSGLLALGVALVGSQVPAQAAGSKAPGFVPIVITDQASGSIRNHQPVVSAIKPPQKPLLGGSTSARLAGLQYFYAGMNRSQAGITASSGNLDVVSNTVDGTDFHSLTEVSVQDANGNIVEFGFHNGPDYWSGDQTLRLFSGAWKAGVGFLGYNTCADNSANPVNIGSSIAAATGTLKTFSISYVSGKWWLYYDTAYVCSFDNTAVFGGNFSSGSVTQVFGEVAANCATPTTGMGKNALPLTSSSARLSSWTINSALPTGAFSPVISDASKYNFAFAGTSTRSGYYGGPGATGSPC